MGFDCYVQITGIPGESEDSNHKQWIDTLSVNYGMHRPLETGGRVSGRTEFSPVVITKPVDISSALLARALFENTNIPKIEIQFCKTDSGQTPYLVIVLTNAKVADYDQVGNGKGSGQTPMPVDTVVLSYGEISIVYTQLDHDTGAVLGSNDVAFNVHSNLQV